MQIDAKTTPISFETFKSITDSNGLFKTYTDIMNEAMSNLPINENILGAVVRNPVEVVGDNIVFQNTENKNVLPFIDDITKRNNKLTLNKMTMLLYTDYMLPLEFDMIDSRSAMSWSEIIGDAISSMMTSRQDLNNMTIIDTLNRVNIALGRVKIIEGCDVFSSNFEDNKNLGLVLANQRIINRTKRTKFSRGFQQSMERFLLSPQLSLKLLSGLTASSASPQSYTDTKQRFQITEIFGHTYETTPMYLGQNIGMSEFTDDKQQKQNAGMNTGNLIKPFFFQDLHGLLFYNESPAFYGHNYQSRTLPMYNKRLTDVLTIVYRMNCAVKPIYAGMNMSFFSKIPKTDSYTGLDGNVVPARDYSKKADYDALINELYQEQPELYKYFGWNGSANTDQGDLTKMWEDAKLSWKLADTLKLKKRLNNK